MTDIPWTLPSWCETSACPRWRTLPDGSVEIGTTDSDRTVVMSRQDALAFGDAFARGEVIVGTDR